IGAVVISAGHMRNVANAANGRKITTYQDMTSQPGINAARRPESVYPIAPETTVPSKNRSPDRKFSPPFRRNIKVSKLKSPRWHSPTKNRNSGAHEQRSPPPRRHRLKPTSPGP